MASVPNARFCTGIRWPLLTACAAAVPMQPRPNSGELFFGQWEGNSELKQPCCPPDRGRACSGFLSLPDFKRGAAAGFPGEFAGPRLIIQPHALNHLAVFKLIDDQVNLALLIAPRDDDVQL